jgi:ribosome maturation factor RimP
MKTDNSQQEEILRQYAEKAIAYDKAFEIASISFDGPEENILASVTLWHPEKVNLQMCEKVSEIMNEMLDKDDPFKEHYTLEVQSLSLSRKLKTADDFRRAVGEMIKIKFKDKEKAEEIGLLNDWQNEEVTILIGKKKVATPLSEIKHATIEF